MGIKRKALLVIGLLMAAFWPAAAQQQTAPMINVPRVGVHRAAEEQLALQVRNLLDLIARPDPHYATFASLAPGVRLWLIGQRKTRMVEGPAVQDALKAIFQQDDDHWLAHGTPDVQIDGSFGRFTVVVSGRERGRSISGCLVLYGDAIQAEETWSIVNLTTTHRRSGCDGT